MGGPGVAPPSGIHTDPEWPRLGQRGHDRAVLRARPLLLLLPLVACASPGPGSRTPTPDAPHLVLVLADDLGYSDLGFTGCRDIATPELDRLAAEGVVCTDAHVVASVCAPSRAGLITGRYPQRTGFECNIGTGEGLLAGTTTFASRLREAGYETALVGKWHLGSEEHNHPNRLGFEHFTGLLAGSRSYFPVDSPGRKRRIERNGTPVPEEELGYLTDFLTEEGVRRIEQRDPERPLLLFLSYTAPHGPMHGRADLLERYADLEDDRRRTYAAMVTALDEGVGHLRDALEREGMADDTIFVFLSDNGGATNNASDNGPWRGMKGSKWEGGHRVPFVLSWPARLEPGRHDGLVSSLDIAATFLTAAGAEPLPVADGVDLVPHLDGREAMPPHERLLWRRAVAAAVRQGDWKLIRIEEEDGSHRAPILVDLARDPGERTDRAAEEPERVAELLQLLEAWEAELVPPRWLTGEVWRRNQRRKHEPGVLGREAERRLP